jgi:hypothetical protein
VAHCQLHVAVASRISNAVNVEPPPQTLAQRAVDMFLTLVRRGTALAVGVLAVVALICLGSYSLGIAALTDQGRVLWILLGGAFVIVGVGAVVLAITRLWLVKRSASMLVDEFQRLVEGDAGTERVVIETIEASEDVQDQSAVVMSRQFFTLRDSLGGQATQFVALAYALRAMTTFPFLMLLATVVTLGFAGFGLIFLGILIF